MKCKGYKNNRSPCGRNAKKGSDFCWQHIDQEHDSKVFNLKEKPRKMMLQIDKHIQNAEEDIEELEEQCKAIEESIINGEMDPEELINLPVLKSRKEKAEKHLAQLQERRKTNYKEEKLFRGKHTIKKKPGITVSKPMSVEAEKRMIKYEIEKFQRMNAKFSQGRDITLTITKKSDGFLLTGPTYNLRRDIRAYGGTWNGALDGWYFITSIEGMINTLLEKGVNLITENWKDCEKCGCTHNVMYTKRLCIKCYDHFISERKKSRAETAKLNIE